MFAALAGCGGSDGNAKSDGASAASVKALLLPGLPELVASDRCQQQQPAEVDPALITGQIAGIAVDCEPAASGGDQQLRNLAFLEFQDATEATTKAAAVTSSLLGTQDSPGNPASTFKAQELTEDVPASTSCLATDDPSSVGCIFAQGRFVVLVQGDNGSGTDLGAPQRAVAVLSDWMKQS